MTKKTELIYPKNFPQGVYLGNPVLQRGKLFKLKNDEKKVYTKGAGLICKCMGQCTLEGSVQGGG